MATIETTDWMALKGRVDTLVTDPEMAVHEPGDIITQAKDSFGPLPFILLSDVVNDPVRIGIASGPSGRVDHVRSGTLMLTVMWPIARAIGHAQMKEIAGTIAAHFTADTCMSFSQSRLRVTQDASVLPAYVDGAYRVAVVRVSWASM